MQLNQEEIGEIVHLVSKERNSLYQVTKRFGSTPVEAARHELLWKISMKLSREYTEIRKRVGSLYGLPATEDRTELNR